MKFEVATYSTIDGIEYVKENSPSAPFATQLAASFCAMAIRNRGRLACIFNGTAPAVFHSTSEPDLMVA